MYLETVCLARKNYPDFIAVDGGEGGTGAAPMPLIDAVGLPLREALPILVDKLSEYGLRDRVSVEFKFSAGSLAGRVVRGRMMGGHSHRDATGNE